MHILPHHGVLAEKRSPFLALPQLRSVRWNDLIYAGSRSDCRTVDARRRGRATRGVCEAAHLFGTGVSPMERLNWAVLGLIGIVTALGLGRATAREDEEREQSVNVAASSSTPGCDACRIAQPKQRQKSQRLRSSPMMLAPASAKRMGACCDKSLPKSESQASVTAFVHDTKVVCQGVCSEEAKQQVAQAEKNLEACPSQGAVCLGQRTRSSITPRRRVII